MLILIYGPENRFTGEEPELIFHFLPNFSCRPLKLDRRDNLGALA